MTFGREGQRVAIRPRFVAIIVQSTGTLSLVGPSLKIVDMHKKAGHIGRRPLTAIATIIFASAIFVANNNTVAKPAWRQVGDRNDAASSSHRRGSTPQISCNAEGTSCLDPVGVVGEWVHVGPNRMFAAPVCCRWVSAEFRKKKPEACGTEQANAQLYSGFKTYPQQMFGNACKCEENNFTDEYEWRSPHLPQTFNPVDTCRLLGNRTALFVGDSTMSQTASTLMNSLLPGKCQTQVTFALSDTLVGRSFDVYNRGKIWKDWVNEVMPDITVVAVGAHVKTDDASYLGLVDEVLSDMIEMQSRHPGLKFAWKTQQPGGCTNEILSPKDATIAARSIEYTRDKFNWHKFYHRDLLLLDRLNRAKIPYLDMRMLYSRSDAHISSMKGSQPGDCLHFCSPGPLDVIGRLFHQLILNDEWS